MNNKQVKKELTEKLNITWDKHEDIFFFNQIRYRFYIWDYEGDPKRLRVYMFNDDVNVKMGIELFKDVDSFCQYITKNSSKFEEKLRKKRNEVNLNRQNDVEIYERIENLQEKLPERSLYFDGQNLRIRTTKDPILVKMLLDALERYEQDKETIGLIYK